MSAAAVDDHADALLVLDVANGLRRWSQATGTRPATKVLRESVWFFWQRPRLEKPLVRSKYPRAARWSPAAALLVEQKQDLRNQLVIEHIEPMNRVLQWLIEEAPSADDVIRVLSEGLQIVVVTSAESRRLPDAGSPEERYKAAGLDLSVFAPLLL